MRAVLSRAVGGVRGTATRIRTAAERLQTRCALTTRSRADRLDRPVFDFEAGRRHTPPRSRLMRETRPDILETLGLPQPVPIRRTTKRTDGALRNQHQVSPRHGPPAARSVRVARYAPAPTARLQSNLTRPLNKVPMTRTRPTPKPKNTLTIYPATRNDAVAGWRSDVSLPFAP